MEIDDIDSPKYQTSPSVYQMLDTARAQQPPAHVYTGIRTPVTTSRARQPEGNPYYTEIGSVDGPEEQPPKSPNEYEMLDSTQRAAPDVYTSMVPRPPNDHEEYLEPAAYQ